MRVLIGLLVAVAACGGSKAPAATPSPSGGARSLTAIDPDLSSIAKVAARSLRPNSDGKVRFGGVFVGGRELAALGDTVARSIGAERIDGRDGRVPYTIGRLEPGSMPPRTDAIYTFKSFRVAGDRAYVGSDARSIAEPEGALCITLARSGSEWHVMETRAVRNAQSCGG